MSASSPFPAPPSLRGRIVGGGGGSTAEGVPIPPPPPYSSSSSHFVVPILKGSSSNRKHDTADMTPLPSASSANKGSRQLLPAYMYCLNIPRVVMVIIVVMMVIGANWFLISQYLHEMHDSHIEKRSGGNRVLPGGSSTTTTQSGTTIVSQTETGIEALGGGVDQPGTQKVVNFEGKEVPIYTVDKGVWPFTDMDDIVARNIDSRHFGPALSLLPVVGQERDDDNDGNNHQQQDPDSKHRRLYKEHAAFFNSTGCNIIQVPFDPVNDDKCIEYFTNTSNWEELRPLAMEFDQRTVKFEVLYKPIAGSEIKLATMLKVPQRLFPFEAFSEVAAFHADRVLNINRIPPTAWSCVPEDLIRASVKKHGATVGTVKEFLDDSKVANYMAWVEKDFFKYNIDMRWTEKYGGASDTSVAVADQKRCFRMSMQVRIADVGHLLDTALTIPYKAHNDSWQRFMNIVENNEPKKDHKTGRSSGPLQPVYVTKKFVGSIIHISELNLFDWVIGNDDRSPNKNNFVVGGCRHKGQCADVVQHDKLLHPGPPTFIHLDQGMSFYGKPKRNGMSKSIRNESAPPGFCVFRAPLINRMEELGGYGEEDLVAMRKDIALHGLSWEKTLDKIRPKTLLHRELSKMIPKGVKKYVDDKSLRKASSRLHEVLRLVRRCLAIEQHTELRRWVITP